MAPDDQPTPAEQSENGAGQECTPCRGTGRLISGLGGTPHEVACPWCQGTGRRVPGINAQEAPAEAGAPRAPSDAAASTTADASAAADEPSVT